MLRFFGEILVKNVDLGMFFAGKISVPLLVIAFNDILLIDIPVARIVFAFGVTTHT